MVTYYKQDADGSIVDVIEFNSEEDVNDWVKENYQLAEKQIVKNDNEAYSFVE